MQLSIRYWWEVFVFYATWRGYSVSRASLKMLIQCLFWTTMQSCGWTSLPHAIQCLEKTSISFFFLSHNLCPGRTLFLVDTSACIEVHRKNILSPNKELCSTSSQYHYHPIQYQIPRKNTVLGRYLGSHRSIQEEHCSLLVPHPMLLSPQKSRSESIRKYLIFRRWSVVCMRY